MNDHECELLYRRATLVAEQSFRLRSAIDHLRRELAGYIVELEKATREFETIAALAWNAYSEVDTSQSGKLTLSCIVCDERIRFDDA